MKRATFLKTMAFALTATAFSDFLPKMEMGAREPVATMAGPVLASLNGIDWRHFDSLDDAELTLGGTLVTADGPHLGGEIGMALPAGPMGPHATGLRPWKVGEGVSRPGAGVGWTKPAWRTPTRGFLSDV